MVPMWEGVWGGGVGWGGCPWANQRADVTKCQRHFSFISRTDRDKKGLCLFLLHSAPSSQVGGFDFIPSYFMSRASIILDNMLRAKIANE